MKMDNTVALVTGGAKRVGRAIVLELADAGCDVAIQYRHSHVEAEALAEEVRAMQRRAAVIQADLADASSWPRIIDQTVAALGRLDVLVNNAAAFLCDAPDTIDGFSTAAWDRMIRLNLTAPVGLVHHARTHLAASGHGVVVNLGDACVDRPWPDHLAYSASKGALATVTACLARALAPRVRVNAVAPGIARFPDAYDEATRHRLIDRVPLARSGTVEEIAHAVRFLVESGDYITGQILAVDGGRSIV